MLNARHIEHMGVADKGVGTTLPVHRQVAVLSLIAIQSLMSPDMRVVENREEKAGQAAHVPFVGSKSSSFMHGVAECKLGARQMAIPTVLVLVPGDSKHLGHGVDGTFHITVGFLVVRAFCHILDAYEAVDGTGRLEQKCRPLSERRGVMY